MSLRIVVIGGVAAGPKTAAAVVRERAFFPKVKTVRVMDGGVVMWPYEKTAG